MSTQPQQGGGAGYDISASSSAASASRQTVANQITNETGRLTFGTRDDNKLLYIVGGVVAAFVLLKFMGKK